MDIQLSAQFSLAEVKSVLSGFFINQTVTVSEDLEDILIEPLPDIFATMVTSITPGFPTGISLDRCSIPADQVQRALIRLARALSVQLGCRSMCDGTGYGPTDSPFWSIVWIDGICYLADDSDTDADPPGPPRILDRITLQISSPD